MLLDNRWESADHVRAEPYVVKGTPIKAIGERSSHLSTLRASWGMCNSLITTPKLEQPVH